MRLLCAHYGHVLRSTLLTILEDYTLMFFLTLAGGIGEDYAEVAREPTSRIYEELAEVQGTSAEDARDLSGKCKGLKRQMQVS